MWWLVWLQDKSEIGAQTMDPMDLDCAVVVEAPNKDMAEKLARISCAAIDSWSDGEEYTPESYELLRIAEALVGEKI